MFGRERFWVVRGRVRVRTARARNDADSAWAVGTFHVFELLVDAVISRQKVRADELPAECVEISADLLAKGADVEVHRRQRLHLLCGLIQELADDDEHLFLSGTARSERARSEAT